MKKLFSFTALGFLIAALFFAVLPARADDVDSRIRALEDELSKLKTEQAQVRSDQMELKKNALAAEAALPTFTYRPGSGLFIEAPDKSWGIRFGFEGHMRINFEQGLAAVGRTQGETMARRWRPQFNYCVNNCFWEIEHSFDMDGFGTGSAHSSTGGLSSVLQRAAIWIHFEQINPWLPTMYLAQDGPASMSEYRQGSSTTGTQMDYDLLSRNNGFNTGRFGSGIGFNFDDKPLDAIGIPGRIRRINLVMATIGEGDDGLSSNRDQGHNYSAFIQVEPFSQLKSKWLQGLGFSMGQWWCLDDPKTGADLSTNVALGGQGCKDVRLRDNGDGGRQTLADFGANVKQNSFMTFWMAGMQWEIGPYRLRGIYGAEQYPTGAGGHGQMRGNVFLVGHDLFLWSPQGPFTGSSSTPNSIVFGTHFERNNLFCSDNNSCKAKSGFHRITVLVREWDLFYFLATRLSVGVSALWYDASNAETTAQKNIQCHNNPKAGGGQSCKWWDWNLNLRYTF